MLEDRQIQNLMKQVAAGIMSPAQLLEVRTAPMIDGDGDEALRITLVMTDEAARTLTGKQLTTLLREARDGLLREGDERFPFMSYATPSDTGEDDGEDE